MSAWTSDELNKIGAAEELDLASVRRVGTLRNPVTMWVVRHGDEIYVRSVNGRESSWFRGAQARHEAHIRAGGVDKDVTLVETDDVGDELDAAYDAKYGRRYPSIVPAIVAPEARAATLKLMPR
jgi:hypothetical protein